MFTAHPLYDEAYKQQIDQIRQGRPAIYHTMKGEDETRRQVMVFISRFSEQVLLVMPTSDVWARVKEVWL